jgi:hypothetical protein
MWRIITSRLLTLAPTRFDRTKKEKAHAHEQQTRALPKWAT